jgi:hypothetical protein
MIIAATSEDDAMAHAAAQMGDAARVEFTQTISKGRP